jgi:hypothetical protein
MTVNPASRLSFGRALGGDIAPDRQAAPSRPRGPRLDLPTWTLLTLPREKGVPPAVDEVAKELNQRLDLAEPDTLRVLERAAAPGHVTYRPENAPATAELTEAGTDHFAALYAQACKVTDVAFGASIPPSSTPL